MLAGDLGRTGLADVLTQLADGAATGCVHLAGPAGGQGRIFLRSGRVYAATATATAVEGRQVSESLADLLLWRQGTWRLCLGERASDGLGTDLTVDDVLGRPPRTPTARSLEDLLRQVPLRAGPDDVALAVARVSAVLSQVFGAPLVPDPPAAVIDLTVPDLPADDLPSDDQLAYAAVDEPDLPLVPAEPVALPEVLAELPYRAYADSAMIAAFSSELSATASSSPSATAARPVEQVPEPVEQVVEPTVTRIEDEPYVRSGADTAALLRELSSLGLEDAPMPVVQRPQPREPVAPAPVPVKKKKGLFGF